MNRRQNVILITVDSLRASHLGCLGYSKPTTPNIDALAKKGVLFSQAFSNGGGSATSFPTIMTSTYASMNISSDIYNAFWIKLSRKWLSVAEVLKNEGFSTAAFKNFKDDLCSIFGYNRGFDVFDEVIHFGDTRVDKACTKLRYLLGRKFVRANEINKKAISWCSNQRDGFFLWLHYMDAHLPYLPRKLSISSRVQAIKLGQKMYSNSNQMTQKEIESVIDLYDAELKYLDAQIGDLLNKLMKLGITPDNTFFVFVSDHGDQFMEHGEWGHGRLYDEVLHVPLLICGPTIKHDTIIPQQISLLDVAPTIIHLLGLEKPETFCGLSLLPLVDGVKNKNNYVISEEIGQDYSCRTQNWKYIRHDKSDTYELYNLQVDSTEKLNVAYDYPEIVEELDKIIDSHLEMGTRLTQSVNVCEPDFSDKEKELLKNVQLKDENFVSKVIGVPRKQYKTGKKSLPVS
ncbi:MAG: sulfatase-like hydrolase/transferase [Candidatus Bathyarchaeota archaeon]|nr:sulfatase-like hydrolase/transferase [Candidatus Bathyarchaeum sp.]